LKLFPRSITPHITSIPRQRRGSRPVGKGRWGHSIGRRRRWVTEAGRGWRRIRRYAAWRSRRAAGTFDAEAALGMQFHEAVAKWERHLIEQALKAADGNKSDAARRLGIHRRLLYEKLTQLRIP
jgi:DNA-binding NtrC family response regulator